MKVQARPSRGKVVLASDAGVRLFNLCNALAESVAEAPDEELAEEPGCDPERVRALLLAACEPKAGRS